MLFLCCGLLYGLLCERSCLAAWDAPPSDWLSMRQALKTEMEKNATGIPWTIDILPEWISSAYFQEDCRDGRIDEQPVRGNVPLAASQAEEKLRPRKTGTTGVEFDENSGRHLTVPGHRDARWSYRWCVFTFRIDAASGSGNETVLLDVNRGEGPYKSTPKIWYDKSNGLNIVYHGRNTEGIDVRHMRTDKVVADGKTWNIVVCGIRQGRLFASVNGITLAAEEEQLGRFSAEMIYNTVTFLGDVRDGNMRWAYDALVMGMTEPSEAMVRKMTGWAAHRLNVAGNLPADHPYRNAAPVVDTEDFPYRYEHDNERWLAWGGNLTKSETRVNAGGEPVPVKGFERVFYDNFRARRIACSNSGEGDLWMAPGFNTAVGINAPLIEPDAQPDAYSHDPQKKYQTLSLVKEGDRWRGSAFYSVNDLGQGYTWAGPKLFRIRCLFPKTEQEKLGGGLFPAYWSYGTEFLFWRTSNRIELDWMEFDGINGYWYNGLSSHYHYPHMKTRHARNEESYKRFKLYSDNLTEEKSRIPGGFFIWDGRFHTWEFVVDEEMTYVNATYYAGEEEKWAEVCRCPTPPMYLERLDLQLDYALKAKSGLPPNDDRQDFVVDWVEVLQKTERLKRFERPFTAAPRLVVADGRVRCVPHVEGVDDLRYYWFADGYPLTYGAEDSVALTPAESGTKIRCMVKAVGARDMPEAWSAEMDVAGVDTALR